MILQDLTRKKILVRSYKIQEILQKLVRFLIRFNSWVYTHGNLDLKGKKRKIGNLDFLL